MSTANGFAEDAEALPHPLWKKTRKTCAFDADNRDQDSPGAPGAKGGGIRRRGRDAPESTRPCATEGDYARSIVRGLPT